MEKVQMIIAGGMLMVSSLYDLKEKRIPMVVPYTALIFGAVFHMVSGEMPELIAGMLPGIAMLLVSVITQGQIGMGDGLILLAAGTLAGWEAAVFSCAAGLVLTLPVCFYWVLVRKEKKKELPFVPFLSGGFLCQILFHGM